MTTKQNDLYLCCGEPGDPKDPELTAEERRLVKWYHSLKEDAIYRVRAGITAGKPWALVGIEFLHFSDETWKDPKGFIHRDPGVTLYWLHLAAAAKAAGAEIEEMHDEPCSNKCWYEAEVTDLEKAVDRIEELQKKYPSHLISLERHKGKIKVTQTSRDHGRKERQVEVTLPLKPFATNAEVRKLVRGFLDSLAWNATAVAPAEEAQLGRGMQHTVVSVL